LIYIFIFLYHIIIPQKRPAGNAGWKNFEGIYLLNYFKIAIKAGAKLPKINAITAINPTI
jgi:hypothetical protein